MIDNYYELLEILEGAELNDVRRAYAIKLRQYPNESYPDKFQQIQDAYCVLSNEQKRADYDYQLLYGDRLAQLEGNAWQAFDEGDYEQAKHYFRDMLDIKEDEARVYNFLGRAEYKLANYEEAISYFKKAISLEDDSTYYYNLALTYEEMNDIDQAIRTYKKILVIDSKEIDAVKNLSWIYMERDDYEKAWLIVENTLKKVKDSDQIQFLFIHRLFEIAIFQKDMFEMKIARKYLSKFIVQNDKDLIERNLLELYELAIQIQNYDNYKFSFELLKIICEFEPDDEDYAQACSNAKENHLLHEEVDQLLQDESLLYEVRKKTHLFMYSKYVDDFEEQTEVINEALIELNVYERSLLNDNLTYLTHHYPLAAVAMDDWISVLK